MEKQQSREKTPEDRLTSLEILASEQERTIADLSAGMAAQWKIIDRLEKAVNVLTGRLAELEEQNAPETPVTRPPHW